jgi:AcrR family transcriptional regulator
MRIMAASRTRKADGMAESLRDRKRQRTNTELVEAAMRLFDTQGYDQTTVADIAAAADQSPSTFFRYFGTKEDVLFHDVPAHLELLLTSMDERMTAGIAPWPAVCDTLLDHIETAYSAPGIAHQRLRLWQREPALRARWAELSADWEAAIAELVQRHLGRGSRAHAQAIAVAAIGSFRIAITTTSTADNNEFLDVVTDIIAEFGRGMRAKR